MPLFTPSDSDALPLRLGALVRRPDNTTHQPDKRAVPGKPHLFVDADGRMSYEPPTPQELATHVPTPKKRGVKLTKAAGWPYVTDKKIVPSATNPLGIYRLTEVDIDPVKLIEQWRTRHSEVVDAWRLAVRHREWEQTRQAIQEAEMESLEPVPITNVPAGAIVWNSEWEQYMHRRLARSDK